LILKNLFIWNGRGEQGRGKTRRLEINLARRSSSRELFEIIKDQRQNPTPAESKLWQELRRKNLSGFKFRRQHPVAGYILDFYCPKAKIGIEVDGEIHKQSSQIEHDKQRTEDLAAIGVKIIRFWNAEIMNDVESVLEKIVEVIERLKNP
jgi:very-short-patch-repair endonuclease